MNKTSRRHFIKANAMAGIGLALSHQLFSYPKDKTGFKISCVSWCFHGFSAGIDTSATIPLIKELGFDGIQLMINRPEDLDSIWSDDKINSVKSLLTSLDLELVSLAPFFTCYPYLGSSDKEKLNSSMKVFERCCILAEKLGTKQIEMISPFLSEFIDTKNNSYNNPFFQYKIDTEKYMPGQKISLTSPNLVDWANIWNRLVGVIKSCSKIAKDHGLTLIIEPHINSIMSDTNGFLLFWNELKDSNIKLNSDTGWGTQQCEFPPMMIHRVRKHLQIMQFRDVDNMTRKFVPMGDGVVDIPDTLRALKQIDFQGFISFEEVFIDSAREDAKRFIDMVKNF